MAVSDFPSLSSASSASDQQSQQPEESGAGETATTTGSVSESVKLVEKHTGSPATMATPLGTPGESQHSGAEAAARGEAAETGEGSHSVDRAATQRRRQNAAALPAGAASTGKAAGLSSRELSHLQMTETMQALAGGGRGSVSSVGASRPLKHQKQQHGEGIGAIGVRGGRGTSSHHPLTQRPRWHGGSCVSGGRGIETLNRKAGAGSAVRRMCLYGSGALWLPPQQLLSGYSTAPGVAGQPSGRDDLRALVQQQQQQGKSHQHGWRGFVAGGARRNASNAVAAVLAESNVNFEEAEPPVRQRPAVRSLRSYYGVEDLRCAFTQTLQLTNPLTGHTQVMATRKPGFAAAVVNIHDFDAYSSLQMPKRYAALRQKDSLQASHMAFIAPLDDVGVPDKLTGASKKRSPYGWATSWAGAPYATWKDSPRWQRGQQQQRHAQQQGCWAAGDSWEKQPTKRPQMEGENSQQQQDSRQLQVMQKDWHEWQGHHQQEQIQQPQQLQGELQEQRQNKWDTDPPHVQSEVKGMPVPQGSCCQQQQQGSQQQQQLVTTQQQEPLGRARQEGYVEGRHCTKPCCHEGEAPKRPTTSKASNSPAP